MRKVVVSASSLPAGRNMSAQLEYIERVGNFGVDMYHLDVMDGEFVKYKTLDYTYFEQLREKSALLFETHLMINNVERVIDKYINSPANLITIHYEAFNESEKLIKVLKKIKNHKKLVGLAVDLDTDISVVDSYLKYIDMVLVMCVKAGKGGQKFSETALKKIKYVRNLSPQILIEVDGGIDEKTGAKCVRAGADILVSGSYIYNNDTYIAIQNLKGKMLKDGQ